jgi:hypothetical protein
VSLAATLALLLVLAATSLADLVRTDRATLLPLVFVPLLAGIGLTLVPTVVLSSSSALLAVTLPGALFSSTGVQYVRFSAVLGVCIASVATSYLRRRLRTTTRQLAREREAALQDHRRALASNDAVYQRLFAAKIWQDLGDDEKATDALRQALATASELIDDRLHKLEAPPGVNKESGEVVINLTEDDQARSKDR